MEVKHELAAGAGQAVVNGTLGAGAVFAGQELGKNIFGMSIAYGAGIMAAYAVISRAIEAVAYKVFSSTSETEATTVKLLADIAAVAITAVSAAALFSVSAQKVALLWLASRFVGIVVTATHLDTIVERLVLKHI